MSGAVGAALLAAGVAAQWRFDVFPADDGPLFGKSLPKVPGPDPTDKPVEIVYCAGWDSAARAPVSPMSEPVARAQDAAGAQYAVVLLVEGVARAVVEVCWSAHHAEVSYLDAAGQRYRSVAYRRWPDERVRLFEVRGWRDGHHEVGPEGDRPTIRFRVQREASAAVKTVSVKAEVDGGSLSTQRDWKDWPEPERPVDDVAVPSVDGWPVLAGTTGPVTVRSGPDEVPASFPWRPPYPLQPRHITELTTDGARLRTAHGDVLTVKQVPAGKIRLPSGELLVGDPGWLNAESAPLADAVPPGEYAVDVFEVADHGTVACRVTVTDKPVASWHLALREGDHELALGDGEFFGNPVDGATLALVDNTGSTAFSREDVEAATVSDAVYRTLSKDEVDMIIVPGWSDGAFPVWLGRAGDGSLSQYVLDFLVPEVTKAEPA
ncbi:MAG TPA: DUF4241 domain-containing protein [Lentzea sp.]